MKLFLQNALFTLFVPGTVAGFLPWLLWSRSDPRPELSWWGAPLFGLGIAIYGWCVWDFATFGRGTPAPIKAPRRLVIRGLYRYVRNPMYVGVLSVIAGWAVSAASMALALYGIGVAVLFNVFIRLHEEPYLRRTFGKEYEEYCARVGRWGIGGRKTSP